MLFIYAFDGDDIGKRIEEALFNDDLEKAKNISIAVECALKEIESYLLELKAERIFLAGDSVLMISESHISVPSSILEKYGFTFSLGIGTSPSDAVLALKKAKGLGKHRIIDMSGCNYEN